MTTLQIFNQINASIGLSTVPQFEFYRTIFAEGELQKAGIQEPGLYNAMIKVRNKYIYLHDELDSLPDASVKGATMNCLTYAGESGKDELAMQLHAFVVKVSFPEKFDWHDFMAFSSRHKHKRRNALTTKIAPTFITMSGKEQYVLFYYVLDKPIPIFRKYIKKLTSMQTYLAREVHKGFREVRFSNEGTIPRQNGIYARYPVVGTFSSDNLIGAFKVGDLYTLKEINALLPKAKQLDYKPSKATLAEAAEKWPTWNQKCIVEGKDMSGKKYKGPNYALFDWYVNAVKTNEKPVKPGVFEGLAAYAVKSNVTHSKLWTAMQEFEKIFKEIFPKEDLDWHISKAWELYEECPQKLKYWSISYIEKITGLTIPRTKRNGRTQKQHLAKVHKEQSRKDDVKNWRQKNPDGTKAACAKDLGISWVTVNRWWEPARKEPKPKKEPKQPQVRKCEESGCNGTLIDRGYQEWYSASYGANYKRRVWACDTCGCVTYGKARIAD